MKLPKKVRAGDKVSAAWLNAVVDCLGEVERSQTRRRLLRGVGYQVKESAGGTSITIDKQATTRLADDELSILRNEDFQLRIKPKSLCEVNVDTGDWAKILQVHRGRVTDHAGNEFEVLGVTPDNSDAWDAQDWFDMGVLDIASGEPIEVYVRILSIEGEGINSASFLTEKAENDEGEFILIGTAHGGVVEDLPRIYITQHQQGPIELHKGKQGEAECGCVPPPLTHYEPSNPESKNETGLISRVDYTDNTTAPRILQGAIELPLISTDPSILNIVNRITKIEGKECTCNITMEEVTAAINQALASLNWELEATGVIENNFFGELKVISIGNGDLNGGAVATTVSY